MSKPQDWEHPEWEVRDRVHNWRNYATGRLQEHWENLTDTTKQIVAEALQCAADKEEWD